MDNKFPDQLYPHLYLDGPPEEEAKHNYGGWGSYERVRTVGAGPCDAEQPWWSPPVFEPQHDVNSEEWLPVKPAVAPLMPPHEDAKVPSIDLPDPMNFPDHMHYFYQHYFMDAFSTMGHLLQDDFTFQRKAPKDVLSMRWSRDFINGLKYKRCEYAHFSKKIRCMHHLLRDIVSDVPPSLLSSLLYEELTTQRERQQFSAENTGGTLGFVPLRDNQSSREATLIYPRGVGMDKVYFHKVVQHFNDDKPPSFVMQPQPSVFYLSGSIRQISPGKMEEEGHVAVRSDYLCGVWVLGRRTKPRLVEVIETKDPFSCVNGSPHMPNEFVVVNERGAAYLWTMRRGLQKFREESSNLFFNAKSSWRWCEFSSHPRVMVYADRTGAELTDIRIHENNHTLFRIGKTPGCVSGERVIIAKYLSKSHAHHHLINTQFSTYIMDERVPSVPMLKWNHMMEAPPTFACDLPGQTPSQTCKLLLGSQRTQEIMLLQYTGGREHACQTQGPIQRLFNPKECLSHLNLQLPHKKQVAQKRLNVPVSGFAAVQYKDYMSVFQLSETGDVFFQTLKLHADQTTTSKVVPEQAVSVERIVENGEHVNFKSHANSDVHSSQSDSEAEGRQSFDHLEVIDNVDVDHLNASDADKDPLSSSVDNNPTCSNRPPNPSKDPDLQAAWNEWFKPIFKKASAKKRHSHFRRIITDDLNGLKGKKPYKSMEDHLTRLRRDLQEVMRKKESLSHGVTYLPHLNVTPVPDSIDPDNWDDDLSQRLTASWEGNWKSWWEEKLGLNQSKKIAALRKKRQRMKQAKARRRISLSGSFTSSVKNQGSDFGWSSAGSQFLDSNDEPLDGSQSIDMEEWMSRSEMRKKSPIMLRRFLHDQSTVEESGQSPVRSLLQSPLRRPDQDFLTSPSKSQSSSRVERPISSTPTVAVGMDSEPRPSSLASKKRKYLNSLPASQTSTQNSAPDDGFSLSQVYLSSPTPSSKLSLSSQRVPQIRSSSQASQPKKKSRMGF